MSTKFKVVITDARVSNEMTYTPEYTKQGGDKVQAKCVIPFMVTNPGYTDNDGNQVKGSTENGTITAWGKSADLCAKYLRTGKEFSCEGRVNSYQSRIKDSATKKVILNSVGQEALTWKHSYNLIPGTLNFGNDSADCISKELSSGLRPVGYDGTIPVGMIETAIAKNELQGLVAQAKQGPAAWEVIRNNLKALKYVPGMVFFGNARVAAPTNAEQQTNPALAAAVAAATTMVDGLTYADMIGNGWTDEQLLSAHGGKYASLVPPKKAAVPPPPAV